MIVGHYNKTICGDRVHVKIIKCLKYIELFYFIYFPALQQSSALRIL